LETFRKLDFDYLEHYSKAKIHFFDHTRAGQGGNFAVRWGIEFSDDRCYTTPSFYGASPSAELARHDRTTCPDCVFSSSGRPVILPKTELARDIEPLKKDPQAIVVLNALLLFEMWPLGFYLQKMPYLFNPSIRKTARRLLDDAMANQGSTSGVTCSFHIRLGAQRKQSVLQDVGSYAEQMKAHAEVQGCTLIFIASDANPSEQAILHAAFQNNPRTKAYIQCSELDVEGKDCPAEIDRTDATAVLRVLALEIQLMSICDHFVQSGQSTFSKIVNMLRPVDGVEFVSSEEFARIGPPKENKQKAVISKQTVSDPTVLPTVEGSGAKLNEEYARKIAKQQ